MGQAFACENERKAIEYLEGFNVIWNQFATTVNFVKCSTERSSGIILYIVLKFRTFDVPTKNMVND